MAATFLDIVITPDMMDVQHEMGSDTLRQTPHSRRQTDRFSDSEVGMTATRDSFYLATVSQGSWSYIQHHGGPMGFLHLLDDITPTITNFGGSRQYITTGSPRGSVRAYLLLMDYPRRTRLKICATVEVVAAEDHPQLLVRMAPVGYRARIGCLFPSHPQAFDWGCLQHITPRYNVQQAAEHNQNLQQRIHDLEQENRRLQQQLASKGDS